MVDPITEEELKRLRRIKQHRQVQDYMDAVADDSTKTGKIKGKTVKKISPDNKTESFFNRFTEKVHKTTPKDHST
jgi:hypothetical protein